MGRKRELQERIELANQNNRSDSEAAGTGSATPDIKWALDTIKKRRAESGRYRAYYDGTHKQMIRAERLATIFGHLFQDFRVNMCSSVVDAVADRLQVAGFTSPDEEAANAARKELRERMDKLSARTSSPDVPDEEADHAGGEDLAEVIGEVPAAESEEDQARIAELEGLLEVQTLAQDAWDVWKRNRMPLRMGHVHQEAVASGDAYVLVWPDPEDEPTLYPQGAHEVCVEYDKERTGKITKAAKVWSEDLEANVLLGTERSGMRVVGTRKEPGVRLNLYYPDRIEKYAAPKTKNSEWPKPKEFKPYGSAVGAADGTGGSWRLPNEWGVVPIFHFANNADVNEYGRSDLVDAVPVQDFFNYTVFSLLVGVEFQALPQRYLINIEDPRKNADGTDRDPRNGQEPIQFGPDRLLALTGLPRASGPDEGDHPPQIGQLPGANLEGLGNVINKAALAMAVATKLPVHYFLPTAEGPATPVSGESQIVADHKLDKKVSDRTVAFGDTWAAAMALAVRMKRGMTGAARAGDVELDTNWTDTRPRSDGQRWDIAQKKIKSGVPWQMAFEELGYTDEQIAKMERLKQRNAVAFGPPSFANGDRSMGDVLDELGVD